ncbi:unnamed protein product [Oppiella nova]|uniref:Large ribosomal subunit protein bL19m n=1 Tax=Oppiella nova TaxID=334625 RepID=A0A7R9QU02_9ACAR|nr:unnamed protein product [Oppiella nova]CAG2173948.1 unnamed protein product [Oppiella nova]
MMASIQALNHFLKKSTHCLNTYANVFARHELRLTDNLGQQIRGKRRGLPHTPIRSVPQELPLDAEEATHRTSNAESVVPSDLAELRFAFPEFLPKPVVQHRDRLCEQLMRKDLIRRRTVLEIPEFYVGSILAITISDPYAPGKVSRFVGICIQRLGQGTEANFTLRNRVDGQGVEIRYDMYNPTIREIQVLRLEKRLDPHLIYLRDALPEYSTFAFDMTPEPHPPGQEVPLNGVKVVMKKWPWTSKWEIKDLQGIAQLSDLPDYRFINRWKTKNEFEKYDLMKEYRDHIPEEEQLSIWKEVKDHKETIAEVRAVERRKKLLQQTVKKT